METSSTANASETELTKQIRSEIENSNELLFYLSTTFMLLLSYLELGCPLGLIILPFSIYDLKQLLKSLLSAPKELLSVSSLRTGSSFLAKVLFVLFTVSLTNFFFVCIPLGIDLLISCVCRCEEESKITKSIFLTLKFTSFTSLVFVSLQMEDVISWDWNSVLWAVWILLSVLIFFSFASNLFLLASFCSATACSILAIGWMTYISTSYTFLGVYSLQEFCGMLEGLSLIHI